MTVSQVQVLCDGGDHSGMPEVFRINLEDAVQNGNTVECSVSTTIRANTRRNLELEYSLVDYSSEESASYGQIIASEIHEVKGEDIDDICVLPFPLNSMSGEYYASVFLRDADTDEILAIDERVFDFVQNTVPSFDVKNLEAALSTVEYTNTDVVMSLSAEVDPAAGLSNISFYVNDQLVTDTAVDADGKVTGTYVVAENNEYLVELRYTKDGIDYSSKLYKTVENIDKVIPTVNFTEQSAGNVIVTYQDDKSGIASAMYATTASSDSPAIEVYTAMPVSGSAIAVEADQYVHYTVTDKAGNVTQGVYTLSTLGSLPAVEITYPANGSTSDTTDIQLKWKRVEGATYYVIHVRDITLGEDESKTNDFLLTPVGGRRIDPISSQDEYVLNLSDVLEHGKYIETGKVYNIAINAFGSRYKDSWGITKVTIAKPKLTAPQRILPVEQSGTIFDDTKDIMFKWTAVENATQYKVYIKDVTDVPPSEWNNPNTVAPSVYPEGVFAHDNFTIVDGTISLNVGATANFEDGHTYKACVMASDGGMHYEDSEGPVFFFSVGTELDIISDFNIHLTQENNSLTAYMNSSVTAKWASPDNKNVAGYTLEGYLIELSTTENGVKQYACATVGADATEFKMRLNKWTRVDGSTGVEETKKGDQPYLWSVTPIIKTPDGRTVYGHMSAFNLTVYAAMKVDAPKGLDVTGEWIPWSGWVIDPNADEDITASWNTYKGNGHKLRLVWNKEGGKRLGDYSVSKKTTSYDLEKSKLVGEGTYVAKLYAVYSESLYDGCVYTYVESKPATKEFKVGAWSDTPDEFEESGEDTQVYATVTAPVSGTEVDGKKNSTWRWSENGSWASYQGTKSIDDRNWHVGIDIGAAGSDIHPIADGKVVQSDYKSANGNTITIAHTMLIDGKETTVYSFYAHMKNKSTFKADDLVSTSDVIGVVGNTGSSSQGYHLHLAIVTGSAPQANTVGYVYLKNFYPDFDKKTGSDFESLLQTYVKDKKILKGSSSSDYDVLGIDSVTYGNQTFHNPWNFIMEGNTYQYLVNPPKENSDNTSDDVSASNERTELVQAALTMGEDTYNSMYLDMYPEGYWTVGVGHLIKSGDTMYGPGQLEGAKNALDKELKALGISNGIVEANHPYYGYKVYKISDEAVQALYDADAKKYSDKVDTFLRTCGKSASDISDQQYAALVSIAINTPGALSSGCQFGRMLIDKKDWSTWTEQEQIDFIRKLCTWHHIKTTKDGVDYSKCVYGLYNRKLNDAYLFFTGKAIHKTDWAKPYWWEESKTATTCTFGGNLEGYGTETNNWFDGPDKDPNWMPEDWLKAIK